VYPTWQAIGMSVERLSAWGVFRTTSPVPDMKILNLILAFICNLSQAFFHCCIIVIQNSPFCACILMSLVQVEAC
jgi:hypothetical protein